MTDTEIEPNEVNAVQNVQRISFRRIFNALGIEHDGRYAVCPKCSRKSLRLIQNANRVMCRTCFKRPSNNVNFIMVTQKLDKASAISWIASIERVSGVRTAHCATAGTEDVRGLKLLAQTIAQPYAHLCAHHNHKNKFRHNSIAVLHSFMLDCIFAHGIESPVAGVINHDLAGWAHTETGLMFLPAARYTQAKKFIKTHFYQADIIKTQVVTKFGELFCHDKHVIIPVRQDGILVGVAASDVLLESKVAASLIPFGHYKCDEADKSAIMDSVRKALEYRRAEFDTWLKLLDSDELPKFDSGAVIERSLGSYKNIAGGRIDYVD